MNAISVDKLSFTYAGTSQPALHSISFDVGEGEIFGLLGPSGAGKSTTQKILIGLLRGYQGQARALGRDLRDWGPEYYEQVGVSFELPNHYLKLTAAENLQYFRALYGGPTEQPRQLLEVLGLGPDADKRVGEFSKGMRTRLNLARSLLNRPRLLFLDEPTSGLDPVNAQQVKELVRARRAEGTTVFLTTHDMMVADELCDRVAFITDGAIRLIDTPRELKLQHGQRRVQVEYGAEAATQRAEFPLDGLADNCGFIDLLRREPVQTIHTQETTLERIFIAVTGRGLG